MTPEERARIVVAQWYSTQPHMCMFMVGAKGLQSLELMIARALQEAETGVWEAVIQKIARNETVSPHIGPLWNAGWTERSSSLLKWCREQVLRMRDGKPN